MSVRAKLASQSAIIFMVRIFGAGLVFLTQAAIARTWGHAVLGDYLLIMASVNIVAVIMPLGFQTIGTYFAAEYRARGQGHLLRRFVWRSYAQTGLAALLAVIGAAVVANYTSLGSELFVQNWQPAAVLAIATAFVFLNAAFLVGLKHPFAGYSADGLFRPMLLVGLFALSLLLVGGKPGLSTFMWALAIGFAAVSVLHMAFTLYHILRLPNGLEPGLAEPRRWWRFALPWVLISLATDFFFDINLLSLSVLMGREELAIFGVCTRIFSLAGFGAAAVYAVTLPEMFEAEANADRAGFNQKIGDANLIATGISALLFVGVALFGSLVLMLFGPAFLVGAGPLAVLCLALVVRSMFGPASIVLSIHDRPYASLPAVGLGIVTLFVSNWLLVPGFGLMGAACAALIAITIWSAALWVTAYKLAGMDVSILPRVIAWRKTRSEASRVSSV